MVFLLNLSRFICNTKISERSLKSLLKSALPINNADFSILKVIIFAYFSIINKPFKGYIESKFYLKHF